MPFIHLLVFDVFTAFAGLLAKAYTIISLIIASREEPPQRHLQEKRMNHVGFVMKR